MLRWLRRRLAKSRLTEEQWPNCAEPNEMLALLLGSDRPLERKLRLFLVACCRRIWHLLPSESCREAVLAAEGFAAGQGTVEEIARKSREVWSLLGGPEDRPPSWVSAVRAAGRVSEPTASQATDAAGEARAARAEVAKERCHAGVVVLEPEAWFFAVLEREETWQCGVLRDIFGGRFHLRPPLDPSVLAWSGGLIQKLAQQAYDDRRLPEGTLDPVRLAILADAAEEAGCADASLLAHLRSRAPHFRGCWAVDLLTGRE
jgi:hypothetical protein